jgi:hypothetical protein
MSDSGLSDIGLSCFIIGLIRYRTEGLQSDKFFSDIGQGNIDVGYRRQKYLMSRPPMQTTRSCIIFLATAGVYAAIYEVVLFLFLKVRTVY